MLKSLFCKAHCKTSQTKNWFPVPREAKCEIRVLKYNTRYTDLILNLRQVSESRIMYEVRREECVWISMKDSVRLAAKLWIPVGKTEGDNEKFPAILGKVTYATRVLCSCMQPFDKLENVWKMNALVNQC